MSESNAEYVDLGEIFMFSDLPPARALNLFGGTEDDPLYLLKGIGATGLILSDESGYGEEVPVMPIAYTSEVIADLIRWAYYAGQATMAEAAIQGMKEQGSDEVMNFIREHRT